MTTASDDPTTRYPAARPSSTWPPGRPPGTSSWSARRPTPARATPSPRPAAGCRWWRSTGRSRSSDPRARCRSWTCSRAATSSWSTSTCGTTARRTRASARAAPHGLAPQGRRLPQRPRRLVRRPDHRPVGRGGRLHRVHGLHPALVLGAGRGGAGRRRDGVPHLLPARRRPRVPHLLHDGPRQRAGRPVLRPARHDALRPRRGVGGQPRGLARGPERGSRRWARRAAAGTGARTRTGTRPGARPAGPCRSGPAPARPPWRPSAATATATDAPRRRHHRHHGPRASSPCKPS